MSEMSGLKGPLVRFLTTSSAPRHPWFVLLVPGRERHQLALGLWLFIVIFIWFIGRVLRASFIPRLSLLVLGGCAVRDPAFNCRRCIHWSCTYLDAMDRQILLCRSGFIVFRDDCSCMVSMSRYLRHVDPASRTRHSRGPLSGAPQLRVKPTSTSPQPESTPNVH